MDVKDSLWSVGLGGGILIKQKGVWGNVSVIVKQGRSCDVETSGS